MKRKSINQRAKDFAASRVSGSDDQAEILRRHLRCGYYNGYEAGSREARKELKRLRGRS